MECNEGCDAFRSCKMLCDRCKKELQLIHSGSSRVSCGSKQAVGGTGEKRSKGPTKHAVSKTVSADRLFTTSSRFESTLASVGCWLPVAQTATSKTKRDHDRAFFFSFFFKTLDRFAESSCCVSGGAAPVSMRTGIYEVDWVIWTRGRCKSTPIKRHVNDQIREAFILQWRATTAPICCAGLHTAHCNIWWCRAKIGREAGGHNKKANQQEVQTSLTPSSSIFLSSIFPWLVYFVCTYNLYVIAP